MGLILVFGRKMSPFSILRHALKNDEKLYERLLILIMRHLSYGLKLDLYDKKQPANILKIRILSETSILYLIRHASVIHFAVNSRGEILAKMTLRKWRVLTFHWVLFSLLQWSSMQTYRRVYFSLCLFLAISGRSRTQQKLNPRE